MRDDSAIMLPVNGTEGGAALGEVYGFLSMVLREPLSASGLDTIRSAGFLDALTDAGVELDEAFISLPEAALRDRLTVDYTQLFDGPRGHISPYESIQTTDENGELNGPAASAVRAFFEASGFAFDPACGQLPDHIAVELEFMAELARREVAARQSGDAVSAEHWTDRRREFLARHLGVWGPAFGRTFSGRAETVFYREMGRLLADALELDGAALAAAVNIGCEGSING